MLMLLPVLWRKGHSQHSAFSALVGPWGHSSPGLSLEISKHESSFSPTEYHILGDTHPVILAFLERTWAEVCVWERGQAGLA